MTVHLSWIIKGRQPITFGTEPLKPPPGYEDHDMRSLEKRSADERQRQWNAQQAAQKVASPRSGAKLLPVPPTVESSESNWWKWGLAMLVALHLSRLVWKQWVARK